ncbi:outer membrane protein assembly factor BamA [Candidatus Pelagibacter sp. HIMB1495]|uniref:outer membrane protein assembly factor BamA n=1 Tax=unclassified Candidatus Pelagibacter TaxID=2647897 RepID=UPI003F8533CA
MKTFFKKFIFLFLFFFNIQFSLADSNNLLKKISIEGNDRISKETIILFADIKINETINNEKLNVFLKNLYETNFFKDIKVKFINNELQIKVIESPIIDKVEFEGIKAKRIIEDLNQIIKLKSRSSYNDFLLSKDRDLIKSYLKSNGYYFSKVLTSIKRLDDNLIKVTHDIEMGNRAKIKKISFLGDKIFKDNKLRGIIVSEEYKFWKFISGRKYLNEETVRLDNRLLKNFYLNKGYFNVEINSSFAKLLDDESFELIFNINPKSKVFFNNINLNIPDDFNLNNFSNLKKIFKDLKGEHYSINTVNKIIKELDNITLEDEYKSINATVEEKIIENKLDLIFNIEEAEKLFVEKINIFGNNITRENVIRNNLEIDEGDPFNEILQKKSENNLKSLNFFKSVSSEIIDGTQQNSKIINVSVEEKPTGEISAGAGVGTSGGTFLFGVKENNYLGKGLALDANATITSETFKGSIGIENPNFNNSEKSIFGNVQAIEIDRMKANGYKTNKTGFEFGTTFEYYEDFKLGLSTRSFYEKIETDSTASTRQQAQEGNYWDTFFNTRFDYDKRNQKYKTDDGIRSIYTLDLPIISDNYTLTNSYSFQKFTSLYDNNVSTFGFFIEAANSIKNDDIKLTERLFLPSKKLRGFEKGKVGPKDGNDFVGGNFVSSLNVSTTLPIIFENSDLFDASLHFDVANIWGVDYDSSIDDSNKIRSSIGIGVDWYTVIGPVNFSLSEAISKANTDITESFRFNIGTTF